MLPETPKNRIRQLLRQKRWKLEDLASRIGVSQSTVSRWARGRAAIKQHQIEMVAKALGVDAAEILIPSERLIKDADESRTLEAWRDAEPETRQAVLAILRRRS